MFYINFFKQQGGYMMKNFKAILKFLAVGAIGATIGAVVGLVFGYRLGIDARLGNIYDEEDDVDDYCNCDDLDENLSKGSE